MRILLMCLLLSVLPATLLGQEELLRFEKANELYRAGEFQKAADAYEGIQAAGYESPALYYNLGNAYFKLQKIPSAILQYERALRIEPRDEDILYNLRLANLRVIDKIEPLPELFYAAWWRDFVNRMGAGGWAALCLSGLWAAAVAGGGVLLARSLSLQRGLFFGAALMVLVSLLAAGAMVQRVGIERDDTRGVVFEPSVNVKSAPDAQSTDLFLLHEGVTVEFLDSVGEWRKIRLPDGKVGWLGAGAVRVI